MPVPIVVGAKWGIYYGQHLYLARKELGLPIYFYVLRFGRWIESFLEDQDLSKANDYIKYANPHNDKLFTYTYKSFNYDQFWYLYANREVKTSWVKKLKKSISIGYVNTPIIVNEKMETAQGWFNDKLSILINVKLLLNQVQFLPTKYLLF